MPTLGSVITDFQRKALLSMPLKSVSFAHRLVGCGCFHRHSDSFTHPVIQSRNELHLQAWSPFKLIAAWRDAQPAVTNAQCRGQPRSAMGCAILMPSTAPLCRASCSSSFSSCCSEAGCWLQNRAGASCCMSKSCAALACRASTKCPNSSAAYMNKGVGL